MLYLKQRDVLIEIEHFVYSLYDIGGSRGAESNNLDRMQA
jgi:hypothetical protein